MRAGLVIAALGLAGCFADEPRCVIPRPASRPDLRVLSYNVGNTDRSTPPYQLRIRHNEYEAHVGDRIRALRPDVVALQEVLPPQTCAGFDEPDPARSCWNADERPPAVRRLLGDDYSIVCDARRHVDCLGVHVDFGTIRGVEPGGLRLDGAETPPLPPCDAIAGECRGRGRTCDAESSVSAVTVQTRQGPLRVVHAHPTAIGNRCRQRQIAQAFALLGDEPAILLGDWNFDPDRAVYIVETAIWSRFVGPGRRFTDHGERDPRTCARARTSVGCPVAIDHVVTDFAVGTCTVRDDPPLDDGFDFSRLAPAGRYPARIDHYAVDCALQWTF